MCLRKGKRLELKGWGVGTIEFPLFDADNHCYEPRDSFTRFIDPAFSERTVTVEKVDGADRILIEGRPCTYIENEVFDHVGRPGSLKELLRSLNSEGSSDAYQWESIRPEYLDRDARLEAMDRQGVESCFMFPCMGSAVEHYFQDAEALYASLHSFNRWYDEVWGFHHNDRIYASPQLSLRDVDSAVRELEWVLDRGARIVTLRPGPAYGRSPGDPHFDPFWARINEARACVVFHITEPGYNEMWSTRWGHQANPSAYHMSAWQWLHCHGDRPIMETISALIFDNVFGRFPNVRVASIEHGSAWVPYLIEQMDKMRFMGRNGPWLGGPLTSRPSEIFRKHVSVTPFPEDDIEALVGYLGAQSVLMGSDWPHPEGLIEPSEFAGLIMGLTDAEKRLILHDNAASLVAH
jgi:predicted TIM-barrel fold metal-dependent hydrolase